MGPLAGVRVIEIAGIGPGPFTAMMLGDMGADVIRVDRASQAGAGSQAPSKDVSIRSRRSIGVDLKQPGGVALVLQLIESADALIEGFRPGVMERLGLGPEVCLERNPRLVYGRITGWGQDGPLAGAAGHDINYIALAGALYPIGRHNEPPVPPLNLVGDFGGGGMLLAFGIVCGLLEAQRSGRGQVVDAAMIDGSALLTTMFYALRALGVWSDERSSNFLDTGAHYYEVYETADGEYISVGSIEPQFYAELLRRLDLTAEDLGDQNDRSAWPDLKRRFGDIFRSRTRGEWVELLEGTDVCFAPVLSMAEAYRHPHHVARETFLVPEGDEWPVQPAPAPRFSRTPAGRPGAPPRPGRDTDEILAELGLSPEEVGNLRESGTVG